MSDLERLRDKLAKLGSGATGAGLDGSSADAILRGLVELIDETVLPRKITISAAGGEAVFTIAKRRLLSVEGDVSASFDDAQDQEALSTLRTDLVRVFKRAGAIDLHAGRAEIAPGMQAAGRSAEALAAAWGVDLYRKADGFASVSGLLRDKAYAWISLEFGAVSDEGGDPAYLKALKSTATTPALQDRLTGDRGLLAVGGHSFATAIGIAWEGDVAIAFIVARLDLGPLARAFSGA